MRLVLMRHCRATTRGPYADADRPLLHAGEEQAEWTGRALARMGVPPDVVLASPLRRCRQTAEIAAGVLGLPPNSLHIVEALAPGASPQRMVDAFAVHADRDAVLVVGHAPDLEGLAGFLLAGKTEAQLRLLPGGCACLALDRSGGLDVLEWWLLPEQLKLIAQAPASE